MSDDIKTGSPQAECSGTPHTLMTVWQNRLQALKSLVPLPTPHLVTAQLKLQALRLVPLLTPGDDSKTASPQASAVPLLTPGDDSKTASPQSSATPHTWLEQCDSSHLVTTVKLQALRLVPLLTPGDDSKTASPQASAAPHTW
ncbi:hypothetical protein RRG08_053825 [Elysia crispata]|uniref:Uncharacterized protein n=1 Tax=Elysia crispata TaxID=231223 RepID=A0AAE1D9Z4_9GAST|nr:hypothetical protein RRG08_053825 [Elysia crispata]